MISLEVPIHYLYDNIAQFELIYNHPSHAPSFQLMAHIFFGFVFLLALIPQTKLDRDMRIDIKVVERETPIFPHGKVGNLFEHQNIQNFILFAVEHSY